MAAMWLAWPYGLERALIGTGIAVGASWAIIGLGSRLVRGRRLPEAERYRRRNALATLVGVLAAVAIVILWALMLKTTGTFLGLVGGALAIAMKEPLVAIAGRLSILFGHLYSVGDRIQVEKMSGDVIAVGLFYTRMMEIGNWVGGDQPTGRIVQFSNSKMFGAEPVFNFTQNFDYIWDELMLPITYDSDLRQAVGILQAAGDEYSREFLAGAHQELEQMRHSRLLPEVVLEARVYMEVTSNWVQLMLRYVVKPRQRRAARTFIWEHVFARIHAEASITIASDTENLTLFWGGGSVPTSPASSAPPSRAA